MITCDVRWLKAGRTGLKLALVVAALGLAPVARAEWTSFRGPQGDGHPAPGDTLASRIPLQWSETNNIRWKTEIPFRGWSTPVVFGGQVWLTTATLDGRDFFVLCLDAATGKVLLDRKVFHCENPEPLGNNVNTYATPSPAIEAGRVYVHFGSYGTACLDTASYKEIWRREDLPCRHYRGPASSPVVFENLLVLTMDGVDLQYLAALDKATGKTVWKTNRSVVWNDENVPGQMARDGDLRKAHSTPIIVKTGAGPQLISVGAKAAYGYNPRTGEELWRVRYDAWSAACVPVYQDGLAFIVTGFGGKTELLAVRVDGHGDVTDTHVAWRYDVQVSKEPSPILEKGLLYMISDDGNATCLEPATGKPVWRGRIGGNYSASPVAVDGRIYLSSQQGRTTVLKAGRELTGVATNVLENGFMASPAIDSAALFLRTKTHLYRVQAD